MTLPTQLFNYMDFSSLGLVVLGFTIGCFYCSQCWQLSFPVETVRLLLSSGCSRASARQGGPQASLEYVLRTARRVTPYDLDMSTGHLHQNNVRYFDQVQQERIKFVFRSGFASALHRAHGVRMALTDMHVRFRRELRPGQRYEIVTKWCGWSDNDALYLEHTFVTDSGKMVNGVIYLKFKLKFNRDGTGLQTAPELMATVANSGQNKVMSPTIPECVLHWEAANQCSSEALRRAAGLSPTTSVDVDHASTRSSTQRTGHTNTESRKRV